MEGGCAGLRGALPQSLLHDRAGAAVRLRARGLWRELHRSRAGAHRLQCRLGAVADPRRLFGRPLWSALRADRRRRVRRRRLCGRGTCPFVRSIRRHVRARRSRQHGLSPGRLFPPRASQRAGAARAHLRVPHLRRDSRRGGRTRYAPGDGEPLRLARGLCRRRHSRLRGARDPPRAAARARSGMGGEAPSWRTKRGPACERRMAASFLAADHSQSLLLYSLCR